MAPKLLCSMLIEQLHYNVVSVITGSVYMDPEDCFTMRLNCIYFSDMNTEYISLSFLETSKFS